MFTPSQAATLCEDLSLARGVPRSLREEARHQLYFHLRPTAEVFETWQARRMSFVPPPHWHQHNPSITRLGDKLYCALRATNYTVTHRGPVPNEWGPCFSRNFLLHIDPATLSDKFFTEVCLPDYPADRPTPGRPSGFEDMRIFEWGNDLWGMLTRCDQNEEGWSELWVGQIVGGDFESLHRMRSPDRRQPEKNWIPVTGGPGQMRFIYSSDPTVIVDATGKKLGESMPEIAADHFRGSSQAVPFEGGLLVLIHSVTLHQGWPRNMHRFAWFDNRLRLAKVSDAFLFPTSFDEDFMSGYQYGMGLCFHPDEKRLILSYSVGECQAWLATIEAGEVSGKLRSVQQWQ